MVEAGRDNRDPSSGDTGAPPCAVESITAVLHVEAVHLQLPGILTVLLRYRPARTAEFLGPLTEGVTLNVPGIQNFNHSNGGDNRYAQIS